MATVLISPKTDVLGLKPFVIQARTVPFVVFSFKSVSACPNKGPPKRVSIFTVFITRHPCMSLAGILAF